jgi:hypothetical protein
MQGVGDPRLDIDAILLGIYFEEIKTSSFEFVSHDLASIRLGSEVEESGRHSDGGVWCYRAISFLSETIDALSAIDSDIVQRTTTICVYAHNDPNIPVST